MLAQWIPEISLYGIHWPWYGITGEWALVENAVKTLVGYVVKYSRVLHSHAADRPCLE